MTQEIQDLFLHEKPARITATLLRNRKMHVREIAKEIDATYSHTVKLMSRMNDQDLVMWQKSGRKKIYMLTPEGRNLAEGIDEFFHTVNDDHMADKAELGAVF